MKPRQEVRAGLFAFVFALATSLPIRAQINTGSDGHDGALNPTSNRVINMADHPDGIYHYTSVNIPANVAVTFIPNAKNTPVVWLVQGNCTISGDVDVSGQTVAWDTVQGGGGGPGGFPGGNGPVGARPATVGGGPGGGSLGAGGTFGSRGTGSMITYGNSFLIPLIGGSGGGGSRSASEQGIGEGGGGGGGALLIAASGTITINGSLNANGGGSGQIRTGWGNYCCPGGGGSGGGIRLVASTITGRGSVSAVDNSGGGGGQGRVRFDAYQNVFSGTVSGVFTHGAQFIVIPPEGQLPQLTVTSIGGVPVSSSPTGTLSTPDAVLSAQQLDPVPIVLRCSNLPLGTPITVSVKPMNGSPVSAIGYNNTGTLAESAATVLLNIPRGGGIIYATAATAP